MALPMAANSEQTISNDNTAMAGETDAVTSATQPEGTSRADGTPLDMENGVVPIADDRGFTLQSKDGKFIFKPYLMLQTSGNFNWYDDEGLDKAYNQDNVANSGFAIPYAIIGFTGRAFGRIDYNICVNAAASGANILQQAWVDYAVNRPSVSVQVSSRLLSATPISPRWAKPSSLTCPPRSVP